MLFSENVNLFNQGSECNGLTKSRPEPSGRRPEPSRHRP